MRQSRFFLITLLLCVSIVYACKEKEEAPKQEIKTTPAEKKKALSEQKLQEVRDLRDKLNGKVALLKKTNEQFDKEITANANEVRTETVQTPAETFEQAIKNKRIKAALEAIQKAQAYKEIVERESRLAGEASVETEGAEKQLRLDIIMLASVDEAKLDELLAKLDLVINKIQPQAKELVLKDAQTNLKPLEDIYKELTKPTEQPAKQPDEISSDPDATAPSKPLAITVNGQSKDDNEPRADGKNIVPEKLYPIAVFIDTPNPYAWNFCWSDKNAVFMLTDYPSRAQVKILDIALKQIWTIEFNNTGRLLSAASSEPGRYFLEMMLTADTKDNQDEKQYFYATYEYTVDSLTQPTNISPVRNPKITKLTTGNARFYSKISIFDDKGYSPLYLVFVSDVEKLVSRFEIINLSDRKLPPSPLVAMSLDGLGTETADSLSLFMNYPSYDYFALRNSEHLEIRRIKHASLFESESVHILDCPWPPSIIKKTGEKFYPMFRDFRLFDGNKIFGRLVGSGHSADSVAQYWEISPDIKSPNATCQYHYRPYSENNAAIADKYLEKDQFGWLIIKQIQQIQGTGANHDAALFTVDTPAGIRMLSSSQPCRQSWDQYWLKSKKLLAIKCHNYGINVWNLEKYFNN